MGDNELLEGLPVVKTANALAAEHDKAALAMVLYDRQLVRQADAIGFARAVLRNAQRTVSLGMGDD